MDATSVVVVVFFLYAIFSSLGGTPSSTPSSAPAFPSKAETGIVVAEDVLTTMGDLPNPDYSADLDVDDTKQRIKTFILGYARKPDPEQAEAISTAIMKYSAQSNVNPRLLTALIARESRFNPNVVSSSGAKGLGQMLSSTAKGMGVDDPFNIDQNVMGTAKYFRYLLDKKKKKKGQVPLAIGSYNEGPNAISRDGLYKGHTLDYAKDILAVYNKI
ncbi:MAG: lytic transglycosylase domain-containing protein [Candidatus Saganbacteria bacterium]|nr:lytic transglycosylase domain-containing protein [Candidatus Saganbacteria bacterium]